MRANKDLLLSIAKVKGLSYRIVVQYYCLQKCRQSALSSLLEEDNEDIIYDVQYMKRSPVYNSWRSRLQRCKPVEGSSARERIAFRCALSSRKVFGSLSEENLRRANLIINYLNKI